MMETLHDSAYYAVRAWTGNANRKIIVISFSGVEAEERTNNTFFGYVLARKFDIPWVGIVAKHNGWYRDGDYQEALNIAKHWADTRAERFSGERPDYIGYGVSMGGYAAIKYSALLELDFVYAMAPQWSIDPHEVEYKSHFHGFYQPEFSGMGIRPRDVEGLIYAFLDPYEEPDVRELKEIRKHCKVFDIPVCRAGHMVTQWLKGSGAFEQLVSLRRDPTAVRRAALTIRKGSSDYFGWILRRGHARQARRLATSVLSKVSQNAEHAGYMVSTQWDNVLDLAASLIAREEIELAQQVLGCVRARYKQPVSLTYVMTWGGELLCFNIIRGCYSRTSQHLPCDGVPIILMGETLSAMTPVGLIPISLILHRDRSGFFLHDEKGYLSSRPEGTFMYVKEALAWEKFYAYSACGE